jgi:elongation factor Tu
VTGIVTLPEGVEMVMPGDNVSVEADLITPDRHGKRGAFCCSRGRQNVGAGVVAEIIE